MKEKKYSQYLKDKKTIFTIICLTFVFVLTILMSFGVSLFFRSIKSEEFWSDLAISFVLCVYCLYAGVPEATNFYKKKTGGRYQNTLNDFLAIRDKNGKRDNEFNQWLDGYYKESKKDYFKSILTLHGNINPFVLDLDYYELDNLKKPFKKNWDDTEFKGRKDTYFRSMSDEQIEIVKEIFEGKINVSQIPSDYFKTYDGHIINSEYVYQSKVKKKNTMAFMLLVFYRILFVFAFAFVFAIIGFKIADYGGNVGAEVFKRVITAISRVRTMLTSFVYGFSLGKLMVEKDCDILVFKTKVNKLFDNDKDFKPLNEDELAKAEYEEYEKNKIKCDIINNDNDNSIKELTYGGREEETRE